MNVLNRKSKILDMYYNPTADPVGFFDGYYLSSVRDKFRNPASFVKPLPVLEDMRVDDLKNKHCVLLYSGGKESFLTSKILDYYLVEHDKLFFEERGRIRYSEQHECYVEVSEEIKSKCDHVVVSKVIERYVTSNRFGRNFPITYWYILEAMQMFPESNIIVGGEWLSEYFLHDQMKWEHSDVLYYDLNSDVDIAGQTHSIVNSILEFDVYRIVSNCFGYDDRWSYYDHRKKQLRIDYFRRMNEIIEDLAGEDVEVRKDLLSEMEFICPQIRLVSPLIYDFRKDISAFLNAFGL